MATATQLMPSPSGLTSMSAFSPYTDSPSSPANFAHVFSNRCPGPRSPVSVVARACANRLSKILQHVGPPPPAAQSLSRNRGPLARRQQRHEPYRPHRGSCWQPTRHTQDAALTPPQIEDDAQVNHVTDDGMADVTSPATDDIVSPASQDSQPKPYRLDTSLPVRTRADSDDAPPSVIHAPAHFKQFVRVAPALVALPNR